MAPVRQRVGDNRRAESHFAIANPPAGAVYLIDPTLRSQYQALPLRVAADAHAATIDWTVDGARIGTSRPDQAFQWPLTAGSHLVSARDQTGRVAEVSILVK